MSAPKGFKAWVHGLFADFDHPDRWTEDGYDAEEHPPDLAVARLTRLFRECGTLLAAYPDENVGYGLSYLRSASLSGYPAAIFHSPPDQARVACVRAMSRLYLDCWRTRCAPEPSSPPDARTGALNGSCYMWWEELRYRGVPEEPSRAALDAAVQSVMEEALEVRHAACQESALLGLNFWHIRHRREVERIVGSFLERKLAADEYIEEYAAIAAKGRL